MLAEWAGGVPAMLVETSLRATVAAALVGAILHVARIGCSRIRHHAWCAVMIAMLSMPGLTRALPGIELAAPAVNGSMLYQVLDQTPERPPVPTAGAATAPAAAVVPIRTAAPAVAPRTGPSAPGSNWLLVALSLYAAGTVTLLLRLMLGWRGAARLAQRAALTGIVAPAAVKTSGLIATPVTLGVIRPTVVLPEGWREWAPEKLRAVLAHELAHVRRRDPLVMFLASLNRCVFWFHPLAWWLERRLAALAEHACDDEALQTVDEPKGYAEILLAFAATVQQRGGRVSWQRLGIEGRGGFEQRIERIVSGHAPAALSSRRGVVVAIMCAMALILVVACRRSATPPPLRENPEVAQRLAQDKASQELYRSAREMTIAQVDELEAAFRNNPDDLDGLKKLQVFYQQSGQKAFGWDAMLERRRPLILGVITRHPEHELAASWRVSPEADPVTYREAKALWLGHAARPDVTAAVLNNAAYFLDQTDPALTEQLLVRARGLDPDARSLRSADGRRALDATFWAGRLGSFYAVTIMGPVSPRDGAALSPIGSSDYTRDLIAQLRESRDAAVLTAVGSNLARSQDPARRQLGAEYLRRALELDPQQPRARQLLVASEQSERDRALRAMVRAKQAELAGGEIARKRRAGERLTKEEMRTEQGFEYDAAAALPQADRLEALAIVATGAYMGAESLAYTDKDQEGARAAWARSKKAAQTALALAAAHRDRPDYSRIVYQARIALAVNALREGDRAGAVREMRAAVDVPPSEYLALVPAIGLDLRLVNYLLKEGERESVAEFLERSAQLRTSERERLLDDARAVREGRMPSAYQYMVSRSS